MVREERGGKKGEEREGKEMEEERGCGEGRYERREERE